MAGAFEFEYPYIPDITKVYFDNGSLHYRKAVIYKDGDIYKNIPPNSKLILNNSEFEITDTELKLEFQFDSDRQMIRIIPADFRILPFEENINAGN